MARDFVHPRLGEEVRAIGGGYTFLKEVLLPVDERQLLVLVGAAQIDTSCCGMGGCGYALVPGYVLGLKTRKAADGRPVSVVEPIDDVALRRDLAARIKKAEMVQDVQFWSTKEEVP